MALAGEKRQWMPLSNGEVVGKIYVTFGVLFFIMMLISILITMLFWTRGTPVFQKFQKLTFKLIAMFKFSVDFYVLEKV